MWGDIGDIMDIFTRVGVDARISRRSDVDFDFVFLYLVWRCADLTVAEKAFIVPSQKYAWTRGAPPRRLYPTHQKITLTLLLYFWR